MTEKEYNEKMKEFKRREAEIRAERSQVSHEYEVSMNKPYKHLLNKKVRITYEGWGRDKITVDGFWGGFHYEWGGFVPVFYQIKKDGTMSSRRQHLSIAQKRGEGYLFTMEAIE